MSGGTPTVELEKPISLFKDVVFVLSVKVWIPIEKQADFFALYRPVYDAVVAEPESRFFVVTTPRKDSPEYDPECISWIEGWSRDVAWFTTTQMAKSYYEPYLSTTEKWYIKPRHVEFLDALDGMCNFKLPVADK